VGGFESAVMISLIIGLAQITFSFIAYYIQRRRASLNSSKRSRFKLCKRNSTRRTVAPSGSRFVLSNRPSYRDSIQESPDASKSQSGVRLGLNSSTPQFDRRIQTNSRGSSSPDMRSQANSSKASIMQASSRENSSLDLRTQASSHEASSLDLRTQANSREASISDLRTQANSCEASISDLRTQANSREASSLNLQLSRQGDELYLASVRVSDANSLVCQAASPVPDNIRSDSLSNGY
jgi:hypothetical protein